MKYNPWIISKQLMWPQVLRLPQNEQKRGEDCGQWIHSRMAISAPPKLSFPASFPLRVCWVGGREGGRGLPFFWLVSSPHKWTAKMLTKTQAECFPAQSLICLWGFSLGATFFPPMRVCVLDCVCESVAANSVSHLILWLTNTQNTHT